ncbi:MAG: SDR family oxidoreductase [Proteobacteria bacterium]|nr:SDR family oxidoreductase [Pseudomonadota bacterium]
MTQLQNQKILIIGGSSGIGLAIAKLAAAEGADVVIAGRQLERLKNAKMQIKGRVDTFSLDICNEQEVEKVLNQLGTLNHIVTAAANINFEPLNALSKVSIEAAIASKLLGPIFVARHASNYINPQGSLLFISGVAAYKPAPGMSVVAAVNAGLEGLGKALAVELAPIRVNVLSPGVTDTPIWNFLSEKERETTFSKIAESLPVRKIGTPDDIAQAALMILQNSFTTGTVHHVDGGARLA